MKNVLAGFLMLLSSQLALGANSIEGTWKGPIFRCSSGASPKSFDILESEAVTFTASNLSYEFSTTINDKVCNVTGTSSYVLVNGNLSTVGETIAAAGLGCIGPATLEKSQVAVEVVGNELRQTLPSPNLSCPNAGDSLISVLVKQ